MDSKIPPPVLALSDEVIIATFCPSIKPDSVRPPPRRLPSIRLGNRIVIFLTTFNPALSRGQSRRTRPHPSHRDHARNHRGNEDEHFHSSAGERHQGGARAIPSQSPADAENHGAGN